MNRAIALLSMAAFCSGVMIRATDALLPQLAYEFSVSVDEAALAITAFTFAYGVCQLAFGWIGARIGPYRTAAIGASFGASGALISAVSNDLATLALGRLWSGMTLAAVIPMGMAFIGETISYERRQPVIARFISCAVMGMISGQALAGVFAQWLDWRGLFWLLTAGLTIVAAGMWLVLRGTDAPTTKRQTTSANPVTAYLRVFQQPWARTVLVAVSLEGSLFGIYPFLSPHLAENFGAQPLWIGATVACFGLGGLVYAFFVGPLHRKLGESRLAMSGGGCMVLGYLGLAVSPTMAGLALGAFLAGLGYSMMHNTLQTNATEMAPFDRSAAIALFAFSLFVSQALGTWLAGQLSLWTGYPALFLAAATGFLLLGLWLGSALQRKPQG